MVSLSLPSMLTLSQLPLRFAWFSDVLASGARTVVAVDGGRAEVTLDAPRILVDRYGTDPPRPDREVRRARWFRINGDGKERTPRPSSARRKRVAIKAALCRSCGVGRQRRHFMATSTKAFASSSSRSPVSASLLLLLLLLSGIPSFRLTLPASLKVKFARSSASLHAGQKHRFRHALVSPAT